MGLLDRFRRSDALIPVDTSPPISNLPVPVGPEPPPNSYAALSVEGRRAWASVSASPSSPEGLLVKAFLEKPIRRSSAVSVGVPDIGFKGIRQQLFQRFNLVDLYAIAANNSVLKTATGNLKQEVFRRGLRWDPAFAFRHKHTGKDYELDELRGMTREDRVQLAPMLRAPDMAQRTRFEQVMQCINVYDQSFLLLLKILEDDLNVADDAFLFLSSDYWLGWQNGQEIVKRRVRQMFRLDPVFVEFDLDRENRPGFAHHLCLLHRDMLLDIPPDEDWHSHWEGRCPIDGHTTYPVMYRYSPYKGTFGMTTGMQGPNAQSMYLVKGEVVHSSKFSPSELYGYSPVLSIYEKALSLIGMDRYLYDYFFERQMPQGVVTTITDNPEDLETRKEQVLSETLNNPHYIPWLAVSSKTGQGRTEFVRFAYTLDELQFLPVQEHIEQSVSALYGIPALFMGREEGIGGLNNESQQITRLSRGAQLSQDVYNTEILPKVLDAFGITDWALSLETSEEQSEKFDLEIKQNKAQWANTMVTMGFGLKYDQETDEFEVFGEVPSQGEMQKQQADQQAQMQQTQMGGGDGGGGGYDEGGGYGEGEDDSQYINTTPFG